MAKIIWADAAAEREAEQQTELKVQQRAAVQQELNARVGRLVGKDWRRFSSRDILRLAPVILYDIDAIDEDHKLRPLEQWVE